MRFNGLLSRITRRSVDHPWTHTVIGAVILLISLILAAGLDVRPTWVDLVPDYDPSVASFREIADDFGAATPIIVALESDDLDAVAPAAEELAGILSRRSDLFRQVTAGIEPGFYRRYGLVLLSADELEERIGIWSVNSLTGYLDRLNESILRRIERLKTSASNEPRDIVYRELDALFVEGLGLLEGLDMAGAAGDSAGGEAAGRVLAEQWVHRGSFLISPDQTMALIMIVPKPIVDDLEGIQEVVPELRRTVAEYVASRPDIRFRITGMHIINYDEVTLTTVDATRLTGIAVGLIACLFVLAFGSAAVPFYVLSILGCAIVTTMGLTRIVFGRLNMVTSMASLMLAGLGVDFFVHLYGGIREGMDRGESLERAVETGTAKTGSGIFYSALTTAAAFFLIAASRLRMFLEMGTVLGTGLLAAMAVTFLFLPAVMELRRRTGRRTVRILSVVTVVPLLFMSIDKLRRLFRRLFRRPSSRMSPRSAGRGVFHRLGTVCRRYPLAVLLGVAVSVAIPAFFWHRTGIDYNLLNLEMRGSEAVELQYEIVRRFGFSDGPIYYASDGPEQERSRYLGVSALPKVAFVDSVSRYAPPPELQELRRAVLARFRSEIDPDRPVPRIVLAAVNVRAQRLADNLDEYLSLFSAPQSVSGPHDTAYTSIFLRRPDLAAQAERIRDSAETLPPLSQMRAMDSFQRGFFAALHRALRPMMDPEPYTVADLPESIRGSYMKDGRYLSVVYSRDDVWEDPRNSAFLGQVRGVVPESTGTILFVEAVIREVSKEGRRALLLCVAAVVLILLFDLRNLYDTLIAMSPLVTGLLLTHGIFGIMGIDYTLLMFVVLPLIVGIGIDNGIHLVHRYRAEGEVTPALAGTGKALFLTTLTTVIGFGSLMFARWRGFYGVGLFLTVGIFSCFLMSVTVVPAALVFKERLRRPSHRE
jgi:uncharacterized protein